MKHLELHILQSVPVACLNRDDLNSPKTAIFGGVQRARVSSQSWKRAIREMAKEISPEYFKGERTRFMFEPLVKEMMGVGLSPADAEKAAKEVVDELVNLDTKKNEHIKSKTLYFMSPMELKALAKSYVDKKDAKKDDKKEVKKDEKKKK